MLKKLLDIAYEPIGNLGLSQAFDELIPIDGGQCFPNYDVEGLAVSHSIRICRKQWVPDRLRGLQNRSTEAHPFSIILDGDHDRLTITGIIRPIRRDRRVIQTRSLCDLA